MGNYHQYEMTCYFEKLEIPDDLPFFDYNATYCLVNHGYTERKRWEFIQDMKKISSHNLYRLIIIKETNEDETIHKQHQFCNGEHKSVDAIVTYPHIVW